MILKFPNLDNMIRKNVRARIRADIKQTNPHKIVVPDIFQRFHMNPNISLYRKSKETVDNVKSYTLNKRLLGSSPYYLLFPESILPDGLTLVFINVMRLKFLTDSINKLSVEHNCKREKQKEDTMDYLI
ncbi:hypothetical protein RIR_jg23951.t1 [Rhizophagus irregularis DAOM 181602=DAOM 197198]|nr:hypothetical protein RIR_jg23951.t1 [Rhizophagus irregularis DAOM 181602=DAOM 197198]